MRGKRKGPVIRQDTRAKSNPARNRKARPSVAELEELVERARAKYTFGMTCAVGAVFLCSFMWLACAF